MDKKPSQERPKKGKKRKRTQQSRLEEYWVKTTPKVVECVDLVSDSDEEVPELVQTPAKIFETPAKVFDTCIEIAEPSVEVAERSVQIIETPVECIEILDSDDETAEAHDVFDSFQEMLQGIQCISLDNTIQQVECEVVTDDIILVETSELVVETTEISKPASVRTTEETKEEHLKTTVAIDSANKRIEAEAVSMATKEGAAAPMATIEEIEGDSFEKTLDIDLIDEIVETAFAMDSANEILEEEVVMATAEEAVAMATEEKAAVAMETSEQVEEPIPAMTFVQKTDIPFAISENNRLRELGVQKMRIVNIFMQTKLVQEIPVLMYKFNDNYFNRVYIEGIITSFHITSDYMYRALVTDGSAVIRVLFYRQNMKEFKKELEELYGRTANALPKKDFLEYNQMTDRDFLLQLRNGVKNEFAKTVIHHQSKKLLKIVEKQLYFNFGTKVQIMGRLLKTNDPIDESAWAVFVHNLKVV